MSINQDSDGDSIKEKLERGIYSLSRAPRILDMDVCGNIYVNRRGPYPDEKESLEDMDWEEDKLRTQKLQADSDGEWNFLAGIINAKHFDSRESCDALFVGKNEPGHSLLSHVEHGISFKKALKLLNVEISCNMDYYLSNKVEIENDLNRKLDASIDLNDKVLVKKLEAELFYTLMCKLFGGSENEEAISDSRPEVDDETLTTLFDKTFMLNEFHLLSSDDNNYKFATARRGNYYLLFFYVTS